MAARNKAAGTPSTKSGADDCAGGARDVGQCSAVRALFTGDFDCDTRFAGSAFGDNVVWIESPVERLSGHCDLAIGRIDRYQHRSGSGSGGRCVSIGITNEAESTLAKLAEHSFLVRAGKEKSVAATKTYTGQLLCVYLLAYALGASIELEDLQRLADWTEAALQLEPEIREKAERYCFMQHAVCVGRGLNYANSFEFALKLMETCYVVAERFSSADLLHGPIAMLEASFPAFLFCPPGVTWKATSELLAKLESIKVETLTITDKSNRHATSLKAIQKGRLVIDAELSHRGSLPEDVYTPIPYIIPAQLFAAHLAEVKGLNPDQPRTLSKVTKTI